SWMLALTGLSCAAFVLLPLTSFAGPGLMLALIVLWAATSSALRAPPWALLSRYAARPDLPWLSTLVLSGTAVASAAAPYIAAAAAAGAVASLASVLAPGLPALLAAQFVAGGCWGAICVGAYTGAVGFGRRGREGALLGTLFAVFAVATLTRIGAVATGLAA